MPRCKRLNAGDNYAYHDPARNNPGHHAHYSDHPCRNHHASCEYDYASRRYYNTPGRHDHPYYHSSSRRPAGPYHPG